jgi:hypothetical protein
MGWDRTKHEAVCSDCGRAGQVIKADDDWGRSQTTWIGFENEAADPASVARKRSDSRDSKPLCACGGSRITIGKMLGPCDYQGNVHENFQQSH